MIERYETPEMKLIWSEQNRYRKWLEVELAVCEAWTEDGRIPVEAMSEIRRKADFDAARVAEIEATTHHDVIAFVSAVAEKVGDEGRFIHLGLTSSDVVDTAGSLLILEALTVIKEALKDFSGIVLEKAREYRHLPCVGRTHGIHGEPTTFGLKVLNWHAELTRDLERLELARRHVCAGKISGAVGTYAHCPPHIEEKVCSRLGLARADISNQVLQRDRHAEVLSTIAILGSTLERIATEIRHLQRTEVLEASERLICNASQEEPDPLRACLRYGPASTRLFACFHGKYCALARKGYQPLIGRAGCLARFLPPGSLLPENNVPRHREPRRRP